MSGVIAIVGIIALFGGYMLAWSRRMMPTKAEVRHAKQCDNGTIVEINGFHLWTKELGKDTAGTPVVFIPGGMGLKSSYLEKAFADLSDTNPVIFYDPRGCGRSESKADLGHYTWDEFSDELYELLQHLAPGEKVILAAHSCGCCILYRFLQDHRDMVEKVMLLSCMTLKYEAEMPNIFELLRHFPPKNPKAANQWFASYAKTDILFGKMFARPENIETLDTEEMSMVLCTNINVKMNKPYDYTGEFKNWETPVLVLTGSDQWEAASTNGDCARRIEAEFKNVTRYAFENSGHFFFLENKELCLYKVREFI